MMGCAMKWLLISLLMMAAADDLPSDYQQIYNNQWQREGEIKDGRIHKVKPRVCREYPKTEEHAKKTGCKGFDP